MASTSPVSARRLTRSPDGMTGVGAGIAEYFRIDPLLVRIGIVVGSLLTFPLLPILYVAAWLIIPKRETVFSQPPPPPPTPASAARTASEAHDAAVAMAQARAEVDAIDRVPPSGPMAR